jgi:hypothetical protein
VLVGSRRRPARSNELGSSRGLSGVFAIGVQVATRFSEHSARQFFPKKTEHGELKKSAAAALAIASS